MESGRGCGLREVVVVTLRSLVFTPSEMGTRGTRDGSGAEEGWDLT